MVSTNVKRGITCNHHSVADLFLSVYSFDWFIPSFPSVSVSFVLWFLLSLSLSFCLLPLLFFFCTSREQADYGKHVLAIVSGVDPSQADRYKPDRTYLKCKSKCGLYTPLHKLIHLLVLTCANLCYSVKQSSLLSLSCFLNDTFREHGLYSFDWKDCCEYESGQYVKESGSLKVKG